MLFDKQVAICSRKEKGCKEGVKEKGREQMKKTLFIVLSAFVLTACTSDTQPTGKEANMKEEKTQDISQYEYTFKGNGENWSGVFVTKGTETREKYQGNVKYNHLSEDELRLMYEPSDKLTDGTEISYSFDTRSSGGSGEVTYDSRIENGVIVHRTASEGGAKVSPKEKIKVTVKWSDKEENFELVLPKEKE